ncbi:CapA family protein [Lachnospiraceae bacterium 47-T17]
MTKKRRHICLLLIGAVLFLYGCADGTDETGKVLPSYAVEASLQGEPQNSGDLEEPEDTHQVESHTQEGIDMDVLNKAVNRILEVGSREFLGSYPIDESFLFWFRSTYGKEALEQIADEATAGRDANIWYEVSGSSIHVLWLDYCEKFDAHREYFARLTRKEALSQEQIVLSFTGDMNLDDRTGTMNYLKTYGLESAISQDVRELLAQSDVVMVNNECTYSSRGAPLAGKAYTFRSDPSNVSILKELGVDLVGIANNHVWDYGAEALTDTIAALDEAGLAYVGAGNNLEEAKHPWYFVINGKKIAFVAATQIERTYNYTKEATETEAGVLKTQTPDKFLEVIRHAKKKSDYVVAFVHWGTEGTNYYGQDQVLLAEQFAQAGADAVIGGHPHCLQGITYIGDVPVIYSLGNFWFGSTPTDGVKKKDTGIAQLMIDRDGSMHFRFVPCIQEQWQTYLVTEEAEKNRILDFEEYLSDGVSIDGDGYVTKYE